MPRCLRQKVPHTAFPVPSKGTPEFHPDAYRYQRVKREVREPEFIPGIPGVPDRKPEPTPAAAPSGYQVDDDVRVYLTNVAKLASRTYRAFKCFQVANDPFGAS
jgi:hypothetical protein